jgi:hypothetical protein
VQVGLQQSFLFFLQEVNVQSKHFKGFKVTGWEGAGASGSSTFSCNSAIDFPGPATSISSSIFTIIM